jgi:hypothetical protein
MPDQTLPDDGDVIEFSVIPAGSLIPAIVKDQPARRYRVEHKPLDAEYLLIDVASGHASRVPAITFKAATWSVVAPTKLEAELKAEKKAEAAIVPPPGQPVRFDVFNTGPSPATPAPAAPGPVPPVPNPTGL